MPSIFYFSMRCYSVLWLPKILHSPNEILSLQTVYDKYDISDVAGMPLYLRVELLPNKDIDISIYETGFNIAPHHFITLTYEDESCNGTIQYSYERTIYQDGEFRFTEDEFPEAIYHLVKAFYHNHDFHEELCDTVLRPYTSINKVDIHQEDNKALLHYLACYEDMLCTSVTFLQLILSDMKSQTHNWTITDPKFISLSQVCLRARGYEVYMATLYHSRYNTLCKKEVSYYNNQYKKLRQRAFNIENALRYIRAVEYEYDVMYQQKNTAEILTAANDIMRGTSNQANASMVAITNSAKSSTCWAIFGIIVSLIFGAGSIIYSGVSAKKSSNELREVRTELNLSIDTLSSIVSEISTQVDEFDSIALGIEKLNSQQELLRKIDRKLNNMKY